MQAELVRRARDGDRAAFEQLARDSVDRLHAIAFSVLGDADSAQDATQGALIGIWRDLPKLRDVDRFDAWARRVLIRACYAESKRKPRWLPDSLLAARSDPVAEQRLGTIVTRDQLERGFSRLSIDQRAVVVLHFLADLTLEQVAETLDVPPGTVHSRLHRALGVLRAGLEADERGPIASAEIKEAAR